MKKFVWLFFFWLFIAIMGTFLVACSSTLSSPIPGTPEPLIIYNPSTSTPAIQSLTPATIPVPTIPPTPVSYTVAAGDTLNSIASHFDITLDALLAANPGVSPQTLTIGQIISIPSGSQAPGDGDLLSNPADIDVGEVLCLPSRAGTTCLVPIHNPTPSMLENVKVRVTLLDESGGPLAGQETILPLNILPPGEVLPAAVFFKGFSSHYQTQVELLEAVRLSSNDPRYLKAGLQNLFVSIAWDGLSANVMGQVLLLMNQRPANSIWLVAFAYDKTGHIIAYRRWEWNGSLQPGTSQAFNTTIFSIGPSIDHIEVLVEVRP